MEEGLLILRLSLIALFFKVNLFAVSVLVAKNNIKYEEEINASKVRIKNISSINKNCTPLSLSDLKDGIFVTTHYINKNSIICTKDVKTFSDNSIVFDFGGVKIEKKGKIIYENSEFIRFKNLDGTIEQIYKDGRIK